MPDTYETPDMPEEIAAVEDEPKVTTEELCARMMREKDAKIAALESELSYMGQVAADNEFFAQRNLDLQKEVQKLTTANEQLERELAAAKHDMKALIRNTYPSTDAYMICGNTTCKWYGECACDYCDNFIWRGPVAGKNVEGETQ